MDSLPLTQKAKHHSVNFPLDTSKTAIIPYNRQWGYPFDTTYRAATLTAADLNNIDSILSECVNDWNKSIEKNYKFWTIDLKSNNYRKQLVASTNKNGEKEVWVNCFCAIEVDAWQTEIVFVADGGSCYFNFKISLATRKYWDFSVNGLA